MWLAKVGAFRTASKRRSMIVGARDTIEAARECSSKVQAAVFGAGLAGSLLSVYLRKRGYDVHVYEKFGDILFRQQRVDHKHDRRWDQNAQRSAGRQGARRQRAGIAETAQFRQGHLRHRSRGRQ